VPNPSYEAVCTGTTGHAEVVQVAFDPEQLSYRDLLGVFFTLHDPTTLDRQGGDVGTQYRSAIFYHDDEQRRTAEEVVRELEAEHVFDESIVTKIEPLKAFYPAEEYHRSTTEGIRTSPIAARSLHRRSRSCAASTSKS